MLVCCFSLMEVLWHVDRFALQSGVDCLQQLARNDGVLDSLVPVRGRQTEVPQPGAPQPAGESVVEQRALSEA